MGSVVRHKQRPVTAVLPHVQNRLYAVPKRFTPAFEQSFPIQDGRTITFIPFDDQGSGQWTAVVTNQPTNTQRVVNEFPPSGEGYDKTDNSTEYWRAFDASPGQTKWTELVPGGFGSAGGFAASRLAYGDNLGWIYTPTSKGYLWVVCIQYQAQFDQQVYDSAAGFTPQFSCSLAHTTTSDVRFGYGWNGVTETLDVSGDTMNVGDYVTCAIIWDDVLGQYRMGYAVEDGLFTWSALTTPTVTPTDKSAGTYGVGWWNDVRYVGQLLQEFDTLPGNCAAVAHWYHDQWRAGDKRLFPMHGEHARGAGITAVEAATQCGYEISGTFQFSGYRFGDTAGLETIGGCYVADVDIQQGSDIREAYLQVRCSLNNAGAGTGCTVAASDDGSPALPNVPAGSNHPTDITPTSATTAVASSEFAAGEDYFIDVTAIVQELVNRADWDGTGIYFTLTRTGTWGANTSVQFDTSADDLTVLRWTL